MPNSGPPFSHFASVPLVHFGTNWSFFGLELPAKMRGRKNNGLIFEFDFSKIKNDVNFKIILIFIWQLALLSYRESELI